MTDADHRFLGAFAAHASAGAAGAFPPIADYAFLSDCECTALVASSGNVEWMCLPRPDGPSVFGAMLDRAAGGFRVAPVDVSVPAGRRYLPGTMVLETTWQTRTGWLIVRDALLVGPWYHGRDRLRSQRRPPTDHEAEGALLRTVKCVNGSVEVAVDCEPVFGYGLRGARWEYEGDGFGEAVARPDPAGDGPGGPLEADIPGLGVDLELRLVTDLRLGFEGRRASARTTLHDGDNVFVALAWGDRRPPATYEESFDRMEVTSEFWRQWLNHGDFPDHPWRTYLQRSALTLKGLTYAPTGAMLAAPTTSLPETPGGVRNWDYRYSWVRDSTFMLWGLYTLGFDAEANDFFSFVADAVGHGEALQVMYGVGGERALDEHVLEHLGGYEGARPVRIGNDAYRQVQHDIWGAMLDSVYLHTRSRDHLPERVWPILVRQVEEAVAHWREPDRGIWEVRGPPRHFTSSKVMCWVAADRGSRLAALRDDVERQKKWAEVAAEIRDDVCRNGVSERGIFTQHYETTALDASLLLLPLVRFLPADDERIRATVRAIASELTVDGLVLRYRVDETDDGVGGEEGAFAICSFWLVSALAEVGEFRQARQLCEKLLNYASPLGLYAEEIDPRSGRHLGNFPQAFSHLALINAVVHVIRADASGAGQGTGDMSRWLRSERPGAEDYDRRFVEAEQAGADVHGEATFVASLAPAGAAVLDAGCGTGRVAVELARRGYQVVGVDLDEGMLAGARAKAPDLAWHVADLAGPDLAGAVGTAPGRWFDVVVAAGNVMIFLEPGSEGRVVANLAGLLAPAGLLIAGFQLDGRLPLEEYDAHCAGAGLELEQRWATWDRRPWRDGGPYAVSVHRPARS